METLYLVVLILLTAIFFKSQVSKIVSKIVGVVSVLHLFFYMKHYNKLMHSRKKELFKTLDEHLNSVDGDLVEIGVGPNASNFQFYPDGCSVIAVDRNSEAEWFCHRAKKSYPKIALKKYIVGSADNLHEIEDGSVSVVVATVVLCSVDYIEPVLEEIKRILKPGGRFYFLEHVAGKGWMLKSQTLLDTFWPSIDDSCHLSRRTEDFIRKASFRNMNCLRFNANIWFPPIKPHIMGYAEV